MKIRKQEYKKIKETKKYIIFRDESYKEHEVQCIQCKKCKMISYHPQDIKQLFCNNCHQFYWGMQVPKSTNIFKIITECKIPLWIYFLVLVYSYFFPKSILGSIIGTLAGVIFCIICDLIKERKR